jgi:hypothetical protein
MHLLEIVRPLESGYGNKQTNKQHFRCWTVCWLRWMRAHTICIPSLVLTAPIPPELCFVHIFVALVQFLDLFTLVKTEALGQNLQLPLQTMTSPKVLQFELEPWIMLPIITSFLWGQFIRFGLVRHGDSFWAATGSRIQSCSMPCLFNSALWFGPPSSKFVQHLAISEWLAMTTLGRQRCFSNEWGASNWTPNLASGSNFNTDMQMSYRHP